MTRRWGSKREELKSNLKRMMEDLDLTAIEYLLQIV